MSERAGRRDPHLAVKREVLVRYLDAWTPVALRSHRGATYVEFGNSDFVVDAFRVFSEFADRLAGHHLDMVIVGASADSAVSWGLGEPPAGLSVGSVGDPANLTVVGPMLAHLDLVEDSALAESDVWRWVASLARGKAREVLLTLPATDEVTDYGRRLGAVGLAYTVTVRVGRRRWPDATADIRHRGQQASRDVQERVVGGRTSSRGSATAIHAMPNAAWSTSP